MTGWLRIAGHRFVRSLRHQWSLQLIGKLALGRTVLQEPLVTGNQKKENDAVLPFLGGSLRAFPDT